MRAVSIHSHLGATHPWYGPISQPQTLAILLSMSSEACDRENVPRRSLEFTILPLQGAPQTPHEMDQNSVLARLRM